MAVTDVASRLVAFPDQGRVTCFFELFGCIDGLAATVIQELAQVSASRKLSSTTRIRQPAARMVPASDQEVESMAERNLRGV